MCGYTRSLMCERGVLDRADGSAKWTQDGTIVLAGVYGPKQTSLSLEDAEQAVVGVVFTPKSGKSGTHPAAWFKGLALWHHIADTSSMRRTQLPLCTAPMGIMTIICLIVMIAWPQDAPCMLCNFSSSHGWPNWHYGQKRNSNT